MLNFPLNFPRPPLAGEWGGALALGASLNVAGPQWGVALTPAGVDESMIVDPAARSVMEAIRRQHAR